MVKNNCDSKIKISISYACEIFSSTRKGNIEKSVAFLQVKKGGEFKKNDRSIINYNSNRKRD